MTSQPEIKRKIIARNRRHLQQTEREKGEIHENYGTNAPSQVIHAGTYKTTYEISEEYAAWCRAVKRTGQGKIIPKVIGTMDKKQYQATF